MSLITLARAKRECNVDHSNDDTLIQEKIDAAESIVIDFLKVGTGFGDGSPTLPPFVFAAMCAVVAELYKNRESSTVDPLTPAVIRILERYRDPALA